MDVTFEVSGDLLTLSEGQATILAERLRLFAVGQLRDDVRKLEELGTSRDWLAGTREAADLIEMALVDERSGPVRLLRGDVADAVSQALPLSYVNAPIAREPPAWSRRSKRSLSPAAKARRRGAGA